METIVKDLFSKLDKLNNYEERKLYSSIFQHYEIFLKSLYKYYEHDKKMRGLDDALVYEIKYIFQYFNGNYPLSIYPHIKKLDKLSYQLPEVVRLEWVSFYQNYFTDTLEV